MPEAQIVKWGNSLAVRIPKPVAEAVGVQEGDPIVIEADEGHIKVRRKQQVPTLKELVAKITSENRYEEIPSGPALVITEPSYNRASGLVVVCPLTSKKKPYPFALPVQVDKVEGAVLVDHVKSMDWVARKAAFHSKADSALLVKVRTYLGVLLGAR